MTAELRALSIQHPWAAAIAYGTKRVENRAWTAPRWVIGQVIAIHASKKPDISARPPAGEEWPMERMMHLGAVLAVAKVTGCHHSDECMLPVSALPTSGRTGCSPWAVRGQFHVELANVRPLPEPVPCRGALGLWRLPEDAEKLVREQMEREDPADAPQ
jgi:ASCH domain